jgi:hypothetical protein
MPFFLKRGGNNVPLEVQRWQYFLLRNGFSQVGNIDGQFGLKTEDATKFFQVQHEIAATGEFDAATRDVARGLSYTVVKDDYYDDKKTKAFPKTPAHLSSPSNASRNAALGCFKFRQLPLANRSDKDEIDIKGSCDDAIADWRRANIVNVTVPQLRFATRSTTVTCHRIAAPHLQALFAKWEELDLLHLIRSYEGAFSPRYKRGQSPSKSGHGIKKSKDVGALSNHSFGAAIDINEPDNPFDTEPQLCPMRGCVRELVGPANDVGFFWGGHFGSPKDGMHFEFAAF